MSLQGIPDLQNSISAEGFRIFRPFEIGNRYFLLPDQLEIAAGTDGKADFGLELVRGNNPLLPPAPYGVLDFKLQASYQFEKAIVALRKLDRNATLAPAAFDAGFLRFEPVGNLDSVPAELRRAIPLRSNSLGTARYISRVSTATITLIKNSLLDRILVLNAVAEFEFLGVAPRLQCEVHFNPAKLLGELLKLADSQGQISRTDIVNYFGQPSSSLPLEIKDFSPAELGASELIDNNRKSNDFAEALTDWILMRFGTFVPRHEIAADAQYVLISPQEAGNGIFMWDLSEAVTVSRVVTLRLNPLAAARRLAEQHGIEAVWRETIVPPIKTGNHFVSITANLPAHRPNVLALGANLHAPPRPPQRVQALQEAVEFTPPHEEAKVLLRLSPLEPLEYEYQTFVVLRDQTGIQRFDTEKKSQTGARLDLNIDDFPVKFVLVEAARQLLELATIHCTLNRASENVSESFELTLQQPSIAIALPRKNITENEVETNDRLEIVAKSITNARILKINRLPLASAAFGLHSFPEYGSHEIKVECLFDDDSRLIAIELLPEVEDETIDNVSLLQFAPAQPRKTWNYLARSPFAAGYRFRRHSNAEAAPRRWSAVQSPFQPLTFNSSETIGGEI